MYRQQLARVKRFLNRIEAPITDQVEYEDMLWAFFQNCWHLKDWITNDASAPQTLKDAVNREPVYVLQLCADVANSSKHLKLWDKHPDGWHEAKASNDVNAFLGESLVPGETRVRFECSYFITDKTGVESPALEVAKAAVSEWENLILNNGGSIQ